MNATTLFRHPHLTRGIVHTSGGSYVIQRGLVCAPDAVGTWHGWQRVQAEALHDTEDRTQETLRQSDGRSRE